LTSVGSTPDVAIDGFAHLRHGAQRPRYRCPVERRVTAAWVRREALALPEVEERETWGEATFRVRGKIFLMFGSDGTHASVKASLDDQAALLEMAPGTFSASAYTGRFGWVSVRLAAVEAELMRRLVVAAWRRTAPRRLVAAREEAPGGRPAQPRSRR
jgi:hypothetical protein